MKFKIMLAGQCADELFGGYKRYVDAYTRFGSEQASKMMHDDIATLHETNLERDAKICTSCGVELRLPFLAREIVEFATDMSIELKMEPKPDTLRKLVLRQTARKLDCLSPCRIAQKRRYSTRQAWTRLYGNWPDQSNYPQENTFRNCSHQSATGRSKMNRTGVVFSQI